MRQTNLLQCASCTCFLLVTTLILSAQTSKETCPDLQTGLWYSYPGNSADNWKYTRAGGVQTEINVTTGDTTTYAITWANNCQYSIKYVAGGKKFKRDVMALLKQHTIVYVIKSSTADNYIATAYLDATSNYPLSVDTMWRQEQKVPADRTVFTLPTPAELRKLKLQDTSKFALVYIYRPKKFICSLVDYVIYANDALIGLAANPSAFTVKVTKQGLLHLRGLKGNYKDEEDIDIQFGQKYYLFCDIKWNADKCTPLLSQVAAKKGEEEFEKALY